MIAFAFLDIKIIVTRDAFQVLKLYKKKEKRDRHASMASKLLTFYLSRNFVKCNEKHKPKIVLRFTFQTQVLFKLKAQ